MDLRLSALPYATQAAVRDAARSLEKAKRVLAQKQTFADRAASHGQAAGERAQQWHAFRCPAR